MNLKKHILDHALVIVNNTERKRPFDPKDPKNQHFTASVDISQLLIKHKCTTQECIDDVMVNFLKDLASYTHMFRESKGRNQKGEQIKRDVVFDFDDCLLAYHNSSSDHINSINYRVEPHLHFLFHKNKKLGIGYYQVRKALEEVSVKYNLVFNFQEESLGIKDKTLKAKATAFTWGLKKSSDNQFKKMVENGTVVKQLEDFIDYYKHTKNLQYYLKGLVDLQARLQREDLDFEFNGKNIKNDLFPIYFTKEQLKTIQILYAGSKKEIYEVLSARDNKIARAYLEHTCGFKNIIIDEIEKRMGLELPVKEIELRRVSIKIKRKERVEKDYSLTFNSCIKKDVMVALCSAKNEKEFKLLMLALGYKDFAFKQKNIAGKRSRIGFSFTYKNKTKTINFANLHMSMQDLRDSMVKNTQDEIEFPESESLHSHIKNYKPKRSSYQEDLFEEIYDLKASIDLSNYFIKEHNENNIIEFISLKNNLVDTGAQIKLFESDSKDLEKNSELILDLIQSKKWENVSITGAKELYYMLQKLAIKRESLKGVKFTHAEVLEEKEGERSSQDPHLV
jgi:hypothetical protein